MTASSARCRTCAACSTRSTRRRPTSGPARKATRSPTICRATGWRSAARSWTARPGGRFWRKCVPAWNKRWLVRTYEVGLTQASEAAGFRCRAIWPHAAAAGRTRRRPPGGAGADEPASSACCNRAGRSTQPASSGARCYEPGSRSSSASCCSETSAGVVDAGEWRSVLRIPSRRRPGGDRTSAGQRARDIRRQLERSRVQLRRPILLWRRACRPPRPGCARSQRRPDPGPPLSRQSPAS